MKNLKNWFAISMFAIIVLGFGVNFYQQFGPIKVIDIYSPLKILTPVVKGGGVMIYEANYCLYHQYQATVSRTLIDDSFIPLPITNSVGQLGCHKIEIQVPIPDGARAGVYHMEGLVSYQVTGTRIVQVPFYSGKFTVTK